METARRKNGAPAEAAPASGVPHDLKAKARQRAKHEDGLGWGRVTIFIFRLMLKHPFLIGGVFLFTLVLASLEIGYAALLAPFLEMLMGERARTLSESPIGFLVPYFDGMSIATQLRWYAGIFFGISLLKAGGLYGLGRLAQYVHIVINRDLRMLLFEDVLSVEMGWVNKQRSSNLFTLIHTFPGSASKIVDQYMMGFQNFTSFIAIVITLALISLPLLLISAGIGLVVTLIAIQLTRFVRRLAYELKESRLRLHSVTLEALSALKAVHLFGRTQHTKDTYKDELTLFQRNQYRQAGVKALITPLQSVLSAAFIGGLLVAATIIYDLTTGAYLGTIALFMTIVTRFQSRSSKFAKRRADIAAEVPAMEEIIDHLNRPDKRYMRDGTKRLRRLEEGIRFEDVRFRYDDDEPDVIKGVTFEVPRGHMIAIVGSSGAGKSTLIDLLARLYDPQQGRIVIDGMDLRDVRTTDWRSRVAVVSQDSFLFNTTVRENIRFGRLDASDEEIEVAAKQANAHQFIMDLPEGYETSLGDRGVRLSGGQRQRIAIARAILVDPDLLILDEATSALDTATEALVQAAIDEVAKDRTIIAIAHRLSTVRKANQILVLEDGRIVERGHHDDLLEKRGRYWEYVQLQDLGREVDSMPDDALPLPADERTAWVHVRLHRDTTRLAAEVAKLPGVRAARPQGHDMEVVLDGPSRTLPTLFRMFAEKRFRVESIDLDDLPATEGVYRWSGNGAGRTTQEAVWLELYVDGDAKRLVEAVRAQRDVQGAFGEGRVLNVLTKRPQHALPEVVRMVSKRRMALLAIEPRDMGEAPLPTAFEA